MRGRVAAGVCRTSQATVVIRTLAEILADADDGDDVGVAPGDRWVDDDGWDPAEDEASLLHEEARYEAGRDD